MSKQYINLDGRLIESNQACLSANNRAFHYGDGLFESIRKLNHQIPLLQLHLQRLHVGMAALEIKPPVEWTLDFWKEQIDRISGKQANARIRITVFRAEGGLYTPTNNEAQFLIEAEKIEESHYTWNKDGLSVAICNISQVHAGSLLANLKTCNSLPYVLGSIFARKHQLGDSLLLNQHERLAESSSSNLYLVRDEVIYTPPLMEGCIDGVFRKFLLREAPKAGWNIQEKPIRPADLRQSDEVFLSNAVKGIRWVKLFGDRNYGKQHSQKLQEWVNEKLLKM
ncbi:MAG TPA: aminotransferase class IV [Haliscomenobacter sp.]|uniref:aminotransferase class IV n=1 Tax=Haliscomenobacter sp. TaxID=2717303 RepID=UPI002C07AC92|nr:aminotransferase class IV [Haliscomenobacter sp.]HOY20668.1 aminotransferase class IV [Haliscomenobacter sp.]